MNDLLPLKIGLFSHSTNPRGGVVHALELADALCRLGHDVTVHAPDVSGFGFFRKTRAQHASVPARHVDGDLADLVIRRSTDYLAYLLPRGREFDIYHAHDALSGSVLAELVTRSVIPSFVRTVHHLDDFADPFLRATQERSVTGASKLLCVSHVWRNIIRERFDLDASVVPNGVDLARFTPHAQPLDRQIGARWVSRDGPIFLAVGGIERRKNTLSTLKAFAEFYAWAGCGQLLIVGGASLLDHSSYRREFNELLAQLPPAVREAVVIAGPLPDEQMPSIYRIADALIFPSLREGFGLVVLEALACGTPAIVPNVAPFTEYLSKNDVLWVDPLDSGSIAGAMRRALDPAERARLIPAGHACAARFPWVNSAHAHEAAYRSFFSPAPGETDHARDALSRAMAG